MSHLVWINEKSCKEIDEKCLKCKRYGNLIDVKKSNQFILEKVFRNFKMRER